MSESAVPVVKLPSGDQIPALGQGTWFMGDDGQRRKEEIDALRLGIDLGMNLIDTAEMYGSGASEELVGEAIAGRRDEVFLVSKVLPSNAAKTDVIAACEKSLRRLGTDQLDLYLLHWRSRTPLSETLEGFAALAEAGKIRHWGVSNFDVSDLEELIGLPGGSAVQTNQVLYNLSRRGIEWDLLPWAREHSLPIMAYSPIEQGRILDHSGLKSVAAEHGATAAQVAIAWLLQREGVVAIPKAGTTVHVKENRAALDVHLTDADLAALDQMFPPPNGKQALEII
jgi:diketogulonate reductase-like aldo/keto reductase